MIRSPSRHFAYFTSGEFIASPVLAVAAVLQVIAHPSQAHRYLLRDLLLEEACLSQLYDPLVQAYRVGVGLVEAKGAPSHGSLCGGLPWGRGGGVAFCAEGDIIIVTSCSDAEGWASAWVKGICGPHRHGRIGRNRKAHHEGVVVTLMVVTRRS
jgi:hypothetical protein